MPSLHKTLIVADIHRQPHHCDGDEKEYRIVELAIGTEHAPFRHRKQAFIQAPGEQQKKPRTEEDQPMRDGSV